jgi:hypothetical protein
MKRKLYTPIPLFAALLLAGCQEQVAPELSNPAASGSGSSTTPTVVLPTIRTFSVALAKTPTNVAPNDLNYSLHKSFDSTSTTLSDCTMNVGTTTPQSLNPGITDITCMVEAEEYALYYNGLGFEATATAGACDYITQEQFSYWRYQPGVSLRKNGTPRQVVYFDCSDEAKEQLGSTNVTGFGIFTGPVTRTVNQVCGKYYNLSSPDSATYGSLEVSNPSSGFEPTEKAELCSFRYKTSKNEIINCDEGEMIIHKVSVGAQNTTSPPAAPVYALTVATGGSEEFECGGKIVACMGGPITDHLNISDLDKGIRSRISQIPITGATVSMSVPKSFPNLRTNLYSANFIRQCSLGFTGHDTPANYTNALNSPSVFFNKLSMDAEFLPRTVITPTSVDYITKGTIENNRDLSDPTSQASMRDARGFDQIILADDPFRAGLRLDSDFDFLSKNLWSVDFMKTQPFYKFTCYDKAFEPKGRISIAVREWNRIYDKSVAGVFNFISDINKRHPTDFLNNSFMDAGSPILRAEYAFTKTGTGFAALSDAFKGNYNYNNLNDWDDFLKFYDNNTGTAASCETYNPTIPHSGTTFPPYNDTMMDHTLVPVQSKSWFPGEFQ